MDPQLLTRKSDYEWWIESTGQMRVPGILYGSKSLIEGMDDKVREQLTNVATLPGIQRAAYAMPDAHWGYGFPIGGVAAFDPKEGGVISAGGVGFDISCGVRALRTTLTADQVEPIKAELAEVLVCGRSRWSRQHRNDLARRSRDGSDATWRRAMGRGSRLWPSGRSRSH